jgi:hypothetical protein
MWNRHAFVNGRSVRRVVNDRRSRIVNCGQIESRIGGVKPLPLKPRSKKLSLGEFQRFLKRRFKNLPLAAFQRFLKRVPEPNAAAMGLNDDELSEKEVYELLEEVIQLIRRHRHSAYLRRENERRPPGEKDCLGGPKRCLGTYCDRYSGIWKCPRSPESARRHSASARQRQPPPLKFVPAFTSF